MNPTGTPHGRRSSAADRNPAGRDFSEQDYKDGTVQRHVDELHALTLQGSEGLVQDLQTTDTLALTPVAFHFDYLPQDPAGVLFDMLKYPDLDAFASTSRSCASLVAGHPGFSLTQQALSGPLGLTRQLMRRLRHNEQARDDFRTLQIRSELSGSNHLSPARDAAIRGILQTGFSQDCRALLLRCDKFLEQLAAGEALDHGDVLEVVNTPGLESSDWLLKIALETHSLSPDAASASQLRSRLIELRQDVLMLAARAIIEQ